MSIITQSPIQIGTSVQRFPNQTFSRLSIRIESGGSFKTHIKLGPTDASSTNADFFLDSGEAKIIYGSQVPGNKGDQVSVKNITGDPLIFWDME